MYINKTMPNVTLVIPALDPDERFIPVIKDAAAHGFHDIIVINDVARLFGELV